MNSFKKRDLVVLLSIESVVKTTKIKVVANKNAKGPRNFHIDERISEVVQDTKIIVLS